MKKPLMAGNWKMNKLHTEAKDLVEQLSPQVADNEGVEVVVCPPFTALATVSEAIKAGGMRIGLGAQNMYFAEAGAFTGEISPPMLVALGVDYVIIGHSERRTIFGESDEWAARKVRAVLDHGMTPILCCGESLEEREQGVTTKKIERQIRAGLEGLAAEEVAGMVVAYEPIWAIGTGKTATPEDAQEVCSQIRTLAAEMHGADAAAGLRILYGGSVKPDNVRELMAMPDVEGGLVGGASLQVDDWVALCNFNL
jgi:triosephosphate isomerase